MKYAIGQIYVLLLVCSVSFAEEPTEVISPSQLETYLEAGMEVEGVRAPYYDDAGNLQAQLYGGHARVLDGGVAEITNLRIDVYRDGEVVMTLFAPHCFSKVVGSDSAEGKKVLKVYSNGDVLLEMESVSICGRGFTFSSEDNRFEILNDSRILVEQSAREMKGVSF